LNEDKSSRYHRLKRRAALVSLLATGALMAWLSYSGGSVDLRAIAARGGTAVSPATVAVYVLLLALLQEAVSLPIAFYRSFLLERRYGLSREPLRTWILDHAKASLLGVAIGVAAAESVCLTIRLWPAWWWLASAIALMGAVLLLTRLTPTVLLPMFYTFTPLDRESLRARLMALSKRAGVPVLGVYEWGLGAKTRRANAALVGSGGTRRILLSDTLLAEYSDDEIEVILAHELAHHVHRDIPKALIVEFVLLLAGFGAAALLLARTWRAAGLESPADAAGLPIVLLACGAVMMAATPAVNALSRLNERRADRYALRLTGQAGAFISAMRRLGTQNLAEERPSKLVLWLFHTHPPIEERIEAAKES
jgi:Zn-dependent protease with chaperone function